jgi:hypothetical protein
VAAPTMTTLDELFAFRFLRKRVDALALAALGDPDHTVLWIGAGLSAKYGDLPTWTGFLRVVLDREVAKESGDYAVVSSLIASGRHTLAAEYLHDLIGDRLFEELSGIFGEKAKGRLPDVLSYIGNRDNITTNYDMLLDDLLPWSKSVYPNDGLEKLMSNDFKIVKIHGSVSEPSSCVLSTTSYANAYNDNLYWYIANIFSTNSVIFLGSSMNKSEPFFRIIQFLKRNGRAAKKHYAVLAVQNNTEGRLEGKRLQEFGIDLIPYIPDDRHSFLDEMLNYINGRRGAPRIVYLRMNVIRKHLENMRYSHAAMLLWHTCHAAITHRETRRDLGDLVSEFFVALEAGKVNGSDPFLESGRHVDLSHLWLRSAELIVPSTKSLGGLASSLARLEAATGRSYPDLRTKLSELQRSFEPEPS